VITGVEKFLLKKFYSISNLYLYDMQPDLKHYFNITILSAVDKDIYIKLNQAIKRVGDDYERLQYNTAISALMEFVRDFLVAEIEEQKLINYIILKVIQLIAPMAPHMAEEMWQVCGQSDSVFKSTWPVYDKNATAFDSVTIAVQINGKLRGKVDTSRDSSEDSVLELALAHEKVKSYTDSKTIIKKIYIPNKILNLVIK